MSSDDRVLLWLNVFQRALIVSSFGFFQINTCKNSSVFGTSERSCLYFGFFDTLDQVYCCVGIWLWHLFHIISMWRFTFISNHSHAESCYRWWWDSVVKVHLYSVLYNGLCWVIVVKPQEVEKVMMLWIDMEVVDICFTSPVMATSPTQNRRRIPSKLFMRSGPWRSALLSEVLWTLHRHRTLLRCLLSLDGVHQSDAGTTLFQMGP